VGDDDDLFELFAPMLTKPNVHYELCGLEAAYILRPAHETDKEWVARFIDELKEYVVELGYECDPKKISGMTTREWLATPEAQGELSEAELEAANLS
jgi:FAD/FMN-containing dehydrogenase